ncbi:hypothetical protein HU200_003639 [Digitaria exilis]|uniref:WRKY domain-containing protein n=1 Tax=Digitaria exilis TaxID=1010633 RepID=A0A835KU56_9POAL|nr:hypothetical protein HU200_003639 [Digitaria exilis]
MYPCSAFSIRELSQQLAHVRATISPSSKALVSFSWLTNKVKPNVSENSSKARSTSSSLQGASPAELTVATIAEKLKGLEIGRPELSVSATQNSSKLLSVNRLVLRCIHLSLQYLDLSSCSSLEHVPSCLCTLHDLSALNLSRCYSLHTLPNLPESLCDLPKLKFLDVSGCSRLEALPYSFVTLRQMEILNLSDCKRLKELPQPFGILQELKYLNLSRCHGLNMDVECKLANLMCVTLSPHINGQGFSDSFRDLANHLDMSRWWNKSQIHPQCHPKASSFRTYKRLEQSIIEGVLPGGSDDGDVTIDQIVTWICIVGESGMGKTDLVHRIKRLLGQIVEFTTCSYCYDSPLSVLEEIVIQELTGKKFLLVLDDCDNEIPHLWNDLRKIFNVCSKGSSVIITTKSKQVADLVGAMQICYLNSLSKEDCFMIFQEHVLGGLDINNYALLKNIGWKLVEKCGGNALCIKSLSGLLCHSEIGLDQMDMLVDGILPALRLCYDLLPSHLQQCFKFCSLFPKDYYFTKHQIVRLWIAQGFRSPFHNDKENKFVMHELFHDLAYSVSKNECFRCEEPFCSLPENISHLSLAPSNYKTLALTKEIKELQSLLVLPCSIQNMKHLRFLALNNTKIKGLPFEIGHVATLQTLELKDCCHLTDLPGSISNLTKLRHLDLQKEPGNFNVGMPNGIGRLTDLQTLTVFNIGNDLLHCSVVDLKNLSGLMGHVHITGLENIKIADDAREANIVGKHFLEALTLEWSCSNDGMEYDLEKEIANEILQSLQPSSNIKELVIRNYAGNLFPSWMHNSYLCNIISVTLDNCQECSELPYLGYLPSLKSLFIQKMNSVETFGIDCNPLATEGKRLPRFPSLEVLTLWEMYDLEFWVGISEEDFPQIRRLSISRCPKLINLPPLLSLVHLTVHFSDLKVVRCQKLDLVGSSLEDHVTQKVGGGRNGPTRRSMVLKIEVDANVHLHGWRSYYRCIHRNSTGCPAIKILQPMDIDLNTMYAMYISEHNHDFSNETYLQQHSELGTTRKRKEPDASGDENTTKRNDFFR